MTNWITQQLWLENSCHETKSYEIISWFFNLFKKRKIFSLKYIKYQKITTSTKNNIETIILKWQNIKYRKNLFHNMKKWFQLKSNKKNQKNMNISDFHRKNFKNIKTNLNISDFQKNLKIEKNSKISDFQKKTEQ